MRQSLIVSVFLYAGTLGAGQFALAKPAGPEAFAEFERSIRPLLQEHCVSCHGPKKQQAGLRLDTRTGAFQGGETGPAIDTKAWEKSPLWQHIQPDADKRMPPKYPLSAQQREILGKWLAQGAPWPIDAPTRSVTRQDLWSMKPLPRGGSVKSQDWAERIDREIDAALKTASLNPAGPASKRSLLRRAHFVLTGFPPSPNEMKAWEQDNDPEAWVRLVDRLLEQPSFGERWARHWMDVARYADTKGYVFFQDQQFPWSYAYRDWLIGAFQNDLPYDRFVRLQIAADRLLETGEARGEDLPALGFLTLGGRFMNNQHDIIDDRIDVVTRGLLGLTVSCARCHDHKFDPISTVDYYSLYGIFASSVEPEVPPLFAPPPKTEEYSAFAREMAEREKALNDLIAQRHEQVLTLARRDLAGHLLTVREQRGKPPQDEFMLIADPNDPNPTLVKRWRAWLDAPTRSSDPAWFAWLAIEASDDKTVAQTLKTLMEGPRSGEIPPRIRRLFARETPQTVNRAAQLYASAFTNPFRGPDPVLDRSWDDPESPWNSPRSAFTDLELFPDRQGQGVLQGLRKKVEEWRQGGKGAPPRAHSLVDASKPYAPRVFLRGNPLRLGPEAPRVVPASLGRSSRIEMGSGRLELAREISDPSHPLLARVWVNRVWGIVFGQPLVRTPADFGSRGDPPTHPQLLDQLAADFEANGWSTKKLIKAMLLTRAWRRTSDDALSQATDPENRWLARANPRRLDFEALRDSILAVSGSLDPKLGGPSSRDLATPRRTMYLHLDRLEVPGLFRTFDFPSPDASSASRDQTTTPLQALWFLNSPFVGECAKKLANSPQPETTDPLWVEALYAKVLQRPPQPRETEAMVAFLRENPKEGRVQAALALLACNEFCFLD